MNLNQKKKQKIFTLILSLILIITKVNISSALKSKTTKVKANGKKIVKSAKKKNKTPKKVVKGNRYNKPSITVSTKFPTGTLEDNLIDVQYTATPSKGAEITEVSYSINNSTYEYIYLKGGGIVEPKGTLTVKLLDVSLTKVSYEKVILLNSFDENDNKELEKLQVPISEMPSGVYLKELGIKDSSEVIENTKVSIFDIGQKYTDSFDRRYVFKTWEDFVSATKDDEELLKGRFYIISFKDNKINSMQEKLYLWQMDGIGIFKKVIKRKLLVAFLYVKFERRI